MDKASAVFLDRDGTICEEVGYLNDPNRLFIYPWSYAAIRRINQAGMKVIVVTNQSAVARGFLQEKTLIEINEKMRLAVAAQGARLDGIYYCPHHPDAGEPPYRADCRCRKPYPGMALQAAAEFDLDLSRSYVVGDRYGDIILAHHVGARSVLVLSGYGQETYRQEYPAWEYPPDHIAENLLTATQWILSQQNNMV